MHQYSGSEKAAIILLALGENVAAEILTHMQPHESRRVIQALSRLGRLAPEVVEATLLEFKNHFEHFKPKLAGNYETAQKLMRAAFKNPDEDFIKNQLGSPLPPLPSLDHADAKTLATLLSNEHPQTIAATLAYVAPRIAGETLQRLPKTLQTEIIMRIAKLESIDPKALEAIDEALSEKLLARDTAKFSLGGAEKLAALLNTLDKDAEEQFLKGLDERDAKLANQVRDLMFKFEDLVRIDAKGMQELLKLMPMDKLKTALKTASEKLLAHLFSNMSERAGKMLREDLAAMPKVKKSEVHAAQIEIAQLARKLIEDGRIIIEKGDDLYV